MTDPTPRQIKLLLPKLHAKQEQFFNTLANEPLFGGATRGGKSHAVRYSYCQWAIHVPKLQLDIFRLSCDDVIANHMQGEHSFPDMLGPLEKEGLCKINQDEIVFWHGSRITLEWAADERVKLKHQGVPKQVRTFEESTQIPSTIVRWLRAWMTVTEEMREILPRCLRPLYPWATDEQLRDFFPKIIHTSNPIGISAQYYRRGFVKAAPKNTIFTAPLDDGGFTRIYIPALVEDNPSENAEATRRRVMGMGDANISDALLNENWDAPVGEFFTCYQESINGQPHHVVSTFAPPDHWFKFRAFDWGSADPACCYWIAVSDGVAFKDNHGQDRWFPAGAIIVYREWYICNPRDPSKGVELSNEEMADGIRERTTEVTSGITVTDSKPFQGTGMKQGGKKHTIADVFAEHGVPLIMGNCARVHGWSQMRDRLIGHDGFPMIYIVEDCPYLRDYIPALGHAKNNVDDAQDSGEATHSCDCIRYACTTRPLVYTERPKVKLKPKGFSASPAELLKQMKGTDNGRYSRNY